MSLAQACHQRVDRMHLGAIAGTAIGQPRGRQVAVVVPLDVADRQLAQQRIDLAEQVVAGLGPRDVEHQLLARGEHRPAVELQRPVGVGAEQITVGVDHLGLEPQAELHAELVHVLHQWRQAFGKLGRVDPPVAQTRAVVVAAGEPAVVEHEAFDADGRCGVGQRHHLGGLHVHVERFPGVQVHGARAHPATGPVQTRAKLGVEVCSQAIEALGGQARDQLRRAQRFARGQAAFSGCEPLAHLPLVLRIVQPFDGLLVVARPGQVRTEDQALVVGRAGGRDDGAGKAVVRGAATAVLALPAAAREFVGLQHELVHVLAGV